MDDVAAVSAGNGFSVALKTDGSLWTWGKNDYGQLGDGTNTNRSTPVKIMDGVSDISAGGNTLAIKSDGSLWAWGPNSKGAVGDGTSIQRNTPVKIMENVAFISAGGGGHSMVVKTDGSLWAFGANDTWQIGEWPGISSQWGYNTVPVKIMDGVTSVTAGYQNTMVIKKDGSLWGWGSGSGGKLGDGASILRRTPVKIMDEVSSVSLGNDFTMAIKPDGSLWAWGVSSGGKFGDGTTGEAKNPLPIKIMDSIAAVSAGGASTLAIKTDGSLWGWGWNEFCVIGDGSIAFYRYTPVEIKATIIKVLLDGRELQFDVPPQIFSGRTMVPLRVTFEEMGATVNYNDATKTITAKKADTVVVLTIGDTSPTINGQVVEISQPAIIIEGRTLVPLRFVAEAFGAEVVWSSATQTVTITSG